MAAELLYNRKAELQVGIPGGDARIYKGLRISFEVEKTSTSAANSSKIMVYNLNPDSRAFVEQKGIIARLLVGYEAIPGKGFTEILAIGDVAKAYSERKIPDWTTMFEMGDGEKALNETAINKKFDAGISLQDVIKDVAGSFGKPVSLLKGVGAKVFKNGLSISGAAQDLMDGFTEEGGVEWSILDDEVQVLPKTGNSAEEAYVLSPKTGLLGSPVKKDDGIELVTLLIPKLKPGRRIRVQSSNFDGLYRIRKVNFSGDTHEGPWECRLEAVEVGS